MLVHGLRLLVALITFLVGVAASRLTDSGCHKRPATRVQTTEQVYVFKSGEELPPHGAARAGECKVKLPAAAETVEGGILNGKAYRLPAPVYPPGAMAAGVRGTVYVRVTLDESGRVTSAWSAGGPGLLQNAAVDAAHEARFSPTLLSGRPVRVSGVITYNFTPE